MEANAFQWSYFHYENIIDITFKSFSILEFMIIFMEKNGIHIIDLKKTRASFSFLFFSEIQPIMAESVKNFANLIKIGKNTPNGSIFTYMYKKIICRFFYIQALMG